MGWIENIFSEWRIIRSTNCKNFLTKVTYIMFTFYLVEQVSC